MPTIDQINITTSANSSDLIIIGTSPGGTPNTFVINIEDFFANVQPLARFNQLQLGATGTPANSNALTIGAGELFYDSDYLYISTANNIVKRVALATF